MMIKATFTGKDGSLGYRNGEQYNLYINDHKSMISQRNVIQICREDGSGTCPYNSIKSFLKNWDNVKVIR